MTEVYNAAVARTNPPPRGPQLELSGDLSVAFVNTAAARDDNRQQGVASYAELLAWGQQVGVVSPLEADRLSRRAAEHPEEASAAFDRFVEIRNLLTRLFFAVATEKDLPPKDLRDFNAALSEALPAQCLVPGERGIVRGWAGDDNALDRMLWPVLHAASELLISTEGRPQVRQCARKGCRLYFVDRGPARRRRWCEMKTCGNRAKNLRYYRRKGKASREESFRKLGIWSQKKPGSGARRSD